MNGIEVQWDMKLSIKPVPKLQNRSSTKTRRGKKCIRYTYNAKRPVVKTSNKMPITGTVHDQAAVLENDCT